MNKIIARSVMAALLLAAACARRPRPTADSDVAPTADVAMHDVVVDAPDDGPDLALEHDSGAIAPDAANTSDAQDSGGDVASPPDAGTDTGAEFLGSCKGEATQPEPGLPCSPIGAIRCSDIGAHDKAYPDIGVCIRPNAVRCEATGSGTGIWQLHPSPEIAPPSSEQCLDALGAVWTCQVQGASAAFGLVFAGFGSYNLCPEAEHGKQVCDGGAAISICGTPDEATKGPAGVSPALTCAAIGPSPYYWLLWNDCQSANPITCLAPNSPTPGNGPPITKLYNGGCVTPPGQPPRCAKTCEEIGQKPKW